MNDEKQEEKEVSPVLSKLLEELYNERFALERAIQEARNDIYHYRRLSEERENDIKELQRKIAIINHFRLVDNERKEHYGESK